MHTVGDNSNRNSVRRRFLIIGIDGNTGADASNEKIRSDEE
jgi:hypothetical protein